MRKGDKINALMQGSNKYRIEGNFGGCKLRHYKNTFGKIKFGEF